VLRDGVGDEQWGCRSGEAGVRRSWEVEGMRLFLGGVRKDMIWLGLVLAVRAQGAQKWECSGAVFT
jgi:hypothetical protein